MTDVIDRNKAEPLYLQLERLILDKIKDGTYNSIEKIPSEKVLSDTYALSRITVRRAISELVDKNILIKIHGKGTYVSNSSIRRHYGELTGYSDIMIRQGCIPSRKVLKVELINEKFPEIRKGLHISPEEPLIHISRLLYSNNEPYVLEDAFYSKEFQFFLENDLEKISTYDLMRKKNIVPFRSERTIYLEHANDLVEKYFGAKEGTTILSVSEYVYDKYDNPIHYSRQLLKPNIKMHITAFSTDSRYGK